MNAGLVETDVLVTGGGMAGLAAAVTAVQVGARVMLVEKADAPGGSFALSAGSVGTFESYDTLRERIPDGDPGLHRALADGVRAGWAWLEALGARIGPERMLEFQRVSRHVHPPSAIAAMSRIVEAQGTLRTGTAVVGVERAGDGWRATLQGEGGTEQAIASRALVLATGGFQNHPGLVREYLGVDPALLWERNSGLSDGAGLRLGQACGAGLAGGLDTFYGHCLPAPPARFTKHDIIQVTQYYGPWAVALNREGLRYTDESSSPAEESLAQDTARQPGARAYYVFDTAIHRAHAANVAAPEFAPGVPQPDKLQAALDVGGPVCRADTLEGLCDELGGLSVPVRTALATLEAFNTAARAGQTAALPIPKRRYVQPLTQPPYYAVGVQPGLTFTMGGLRIDPQARVLRADDTPIAGLFAGGSDVGNVSHRYYAGGLPTALVFGRLAGQSAAAYARAAGRS
jgi:FAD binding domain-containing protein